MQKVRIPVSVDPVKSAAKRLSYEGLVPAANLTRLGQTVVDMPQDIHVLLRFDVDAQNISFFAGHAQTTVTAKCQRCNQPMSLVLECDFEYAPLTRRQTEESMPGAYEAVELNELGEVMLHDIVEDELLLTMPIVPLHDPEECEVDRDAMTFGEIPASEEKPNPFAALQQLKRNK